MSSNPNTELPTEQIETMDLATAQRVEQEKLTRRAALRKLGFGAGMAAFALLGVDDLARMVGQRMERMAGDNKVAEQVAKEFQNAGITLGVTMPAPYYYGAGTVPIPKECTNSPYTVNCEACQNALDKACLSRHYSGICYAASVACEAKCDDTSGDGQRLYDCWKGQSAL